MSDSPTIVEHQINNMLDASALETNDFSADHLKPGPFGVERVRSPWDCSICLHPPQNPVVTRCGHLFCRDDLLRWLPQSSSCPLCLQRLPAGLDAFTPIFCHPSSSHTPLPSSPEDAQRSTRSRRRSSNSQSRPRVTSIPPNPYPFAPFASNPAPAFPSPAFPSVAFPTVAFPSVAFPSTPSFSMPVSIGQFAYLPAVAMSTGSLNQFNAQVPLDLSQFNMKAFNFAAFPYPSQYGFGQPAAVPSPAMTTSEADKEATRSISKLLSVAALVVIFGLLWSGRGEVFHV